MFEKVNPMHPDKIADRIAGAIVDMAYSKCGNPKIAVEVLIGHGRCFVISETSVEINPSQIEKAVHRICKDEHVAVYYYENKQDPILSANQNEKIRCGDNGIFKGMPTTAEQALLSFIAKDIYDSYPYDGKYLLDGEKLTICQSNVENWQIECKPYFTDVITDVIINPLGYWSGGINVDTGATNRKLGSDMGDSITGGGLHGKDLSKADVSVNIYAFLKAQETEEPVEMTCSIGDESVDGVPYEQIVETARQYIKSIGGFEKFAEWGLI